MWCKSIINKDSIVRVANGIRQIKHKRLKGSGKTVFNSLILHTALSQISQYVKVNRRRKPVIRGLKTTEISVKISTICQRKASWRASENCGERRREHWRTWARRPRRTAYVIKSLQDIPTRKRNTAHPTSYRAGTYSNARSFAWREICTCARFFACKRGRFELVLHWRQRVVQGRRTMEPRRKKIWVMRRRIIARRLASLWNAICLPAHSGRVFAKVIKMHATRDEVASARSYCWLRLSCVISKCF